MKNASGIYLGVIWQILVKTGHHDLVLLLQPLVRL